MSNQLEVGLRASSQITVTKNLLAKYLGSGTLEVYGTPAMIALMENAAMKAVAETLQEGTDTVGVEMNAQHIAASKEGAHIIAKARLIDVTKRVLTFEIEVFEQDKQIGKATHKRAIIDVEKFLSKL